MLHYGHTVASFLCDAILRCVSGRHIVGCVFCQMLAVVEFVSSVTLVTMAMLFRRCFLAIDEGSW